MKKILTLLIAFMLCFLTCAQAEAPRVIDDAGLFTPDEKQELTNTIADFQSKTGMDFVIYTSDFAHSRYQQDIADDFYDQNGYGLGEDHSGALYYIDMYERIPCLSTAGAMIDYMTDERVEAAHNACYDFLAAGEYAYAAIQMLYAVYGYWEMGVPEGQYRYDVVTVEMLTSRHKALTGSEVIVCALIALVVALLFVKNVQGRYTLKGSTYEYAFRENSNVHMTDAVDDYLRTTTTRTRKVQPPPPGHSGGSRPSGGSGVHRSSSGTFHGGGTGKRF